MQNLQPGSVIRLSAVVVGICVAAAGASGATVHVQRLHDPAAAGGDAVEIVPWGGGFMYVANYINPNLIPAGMNRRPVLVQTDTNLKPLAAYTYLRPGEDSTLLPSQLFLETTDLFATSDGGFVLCGNYFEGDEFNGGSMQEYGAFLLRIDAATLQPSWFRQYPTQFPSAYVGELRFHSVVETFDADGDAIYVVAGQVRSNALPQAMVAGFDDAGNPLWLYEIEGFLGGYGSASEVIVYDAQTVAVTGWAQGAAHGFCPNIQAHSDVLVARLTNGGGFVFASLYGQNSGTFGGGPASFQESGASLARINGSPDLAIVGNTKVWASDDTCPDGPLVDDMLAFRIDPAGVVVWAHRYGLTGSTRTAAVQVKPVTSFLSIAADTRSNVSGYVSDNIAYIRLMAGGGSLAQQSEVFGGPNTEFAAGIIPLGPPYPVPAVLIGTSYSFGAGYPRPYLINRLNFADRRCFDAIVGTAIVPVPLPLENVLVYAPAIPMRSQPMTIAISPIADAIVCHARAIIFPPPPQNPPTAPIEDDGQSGDDERESPELAPVAEECASCAERE